MVFMEQTVSLKIIVSVYFYRPWSFLGQKIFGHWAKPLRGGARLAIVCLRPVNMWLILSKRNFQKRSKPFVRSDRKITVKTRSHRETARVTAKNKIAKTHQPFQQRQRKDGELEVLLRLLLLLRLFLSFLVVVWKSRLFTRRGWGNG